MTADATPAMGSVDVVGGALLYERHGGAGGVPIVAAPGLSSYRAVWHRMVSFLPGADVIAVDLRGRGDSRDLPGPSSIAQHASDIARLVDALGLDRFVFAGHSMGAFVATEYAVRHPDRVAGLVLVDGGVVIPPPSADVDAGSKAAADVAAIVARLGRTFESREQYRDFWRAHPGIGPYWTDAIAAYVDADLHGQEPELRPAASADLVVEDMQDLFASGRADPVGSLRTPAVVLRAERGILDQAEGIYPRGYLQQVAASQPLLSVREIEDVNHYTILLADGGAARVAEAARELAATRT